MKTITNSLIALTVFSGTIITLSSTHMLLMWVGLEMSMLSIIPILIKKANPRSTEAATKYFLTQATASMIFLASILTNYTYSGLWTMNHATNQTCITLITLSLLMKLGLAPFHFWMPEVIQGINLMSGLLVLTWQKLAPLSILYNLAPLTPTPIMLSTGLLSILIGGWGGLNQTQLRKIMAYSSIAHMGWMVIIISYNPSLTLINLMIYILLTLTLFMSFNFTNTLSITSLSHVWNKHPMITLSSMTILLSLGGLPPLTGFLPKWLIIQELTMNDNNYMAITIAILALLNLFFYLRMIYSSSLTMFPTPNNNKMQWRLIPTKHLTLLSPLIIISTLTLPLTTLSSISY
uniref:NADH-ubiquinone oxidoreductase chain 2 n=1 Tax=Scarturus williamsi TaxID=2926630 RepID=A0A7D3QBM3_9RODE|nr:NADH dehydrogenase subunit 2 [Scarturus williamsi]QKE47116.1 NADH dehydrogenase subunit 2 [Scarturus williamsi]